MYTYCVFGLFLTTHKAGFTYLEHTYMGGVGKSASEAQHQFVTVIYFS